MVKAASHNVEGGVQTDRVGMSHSNVFMSVPLSPVCFFFFPFP